MEKSKSKKRATGTTAEAIAGAYRMSVLTDGKKPVSVFKFCASIGIKEADFYVHFASFEALEKAIWTTYAEEVIATLTSDPNFSAFSARERILSFYFTLAETLKTDRSFVLAQLNDWKHPAIIPSFLKGFKKTVDAWITTVLDAGKQTGEVAKRPYLDTRYANLFWLHTMFILQFWSHDESAGFENTDVAIEKSVNLAFDLIGKGVLDNALDFGKFLYQTAKN